MSNKIAVFCTTSSPDEASRIAKALVSEGLAACVTRLPGVHSVYQWEGKVEEAGEILLIAKTRASLWDALRERVLALHSYEVPEIVALPITQGHLPYMEWIDRSTREP